MKTIVTLLILLSMKCMSAQSLKNDSIPDSTYYDYESFFTTTQDTVSYHFGKLDYTFGMYKTALEAFNSAIELNSNYSEAYYYRALTYTALEQYQNALNDFNNAIIKKYQANDTFYLNRSIPKFKSGDINGSLEDVNLALKINSYFLDALFSRALINTELQNYKEAMYDYNSVIKLNPNYRDVFKWRGNTKFKLGDVRGALLDYNRQIELYPNICESYIERGKAKATLGDKKGARKDFDKAIELDPQSHYAYINRGTFKFNNGDKDGACLDYSKAGELGSMDAYDKIRELCQ